MFQPKDAFSGFSVNDLTAAKEFYSDTLGLIAEDDDMGFSLDLPGGTTVFVYQKDDHLPASFTILNFEVEDIDVAMEALKVKGVRFEMYENMPVDEKGILRGLSSHMGPDIAWFKDPAGNILSILQES